MLRACYLSLEYLRRSGGGGGGGDRLLWHIDLKPHASGDFSIAVVQANSSLEDQGQVLASRSATFVGVFDGHGGPEASRFVNSQLFSHLRKFASEQGGISAEVIRKAFEATEEDFLNLVKRTWLSRRRIASVGSCCLVGRSPTTCSTWLTSGTRGRCSAAPMAAPWWRSGCRPITTSPRRRSGGSSPSSARMTPTSLPVIAGCGGLKVSFREP